MDYYSSAQGAPPPPIFHLNARSNSSFDALRSSNGSNAADPRLEDRLRQMTLQTRDGKQTDSVPYPERPGEPDCSYYLRTGVCGFGMNCRFNHPPPHKPGVTSAQPKEEFSGKIGHLECQYYMETGTCKFGATCKYYHPQEKTPPAASGQVQLNFLGLPLRPGEKECTYYTRTGSCKYGLACKFHHPQPSAVGTPSATTDLPLHASTVSSSMPASPCATTLVPSTPLELYQTGTPSWPLPGGQYMHGPKLPGASSQVPSVVSLSQSLSMPGYSTPQPSAVGTATRTTGLPPGSTPGFSTAASFSATTGSSSASASVPYQAGIPSVPVAEALHMQGPNFPGASSHVPGVVSASQFMSTPAWSTSQPSAAGAPTMMQGLPLGGNTSSSSMPGYLCATTSTPSTLASVPYQAGIPSLPASGALYSHGPKLPASSSHVPAVVSPSQLMSVPGLSASQGLTSPLHSLDGPQQATGTGFIYGTGQQQAGLATRSERVHTVPSVGMGALSLQNQMTQNGITFPERPGQPDCHHYMKTGECKFGANCKYHHPKDRATSSSLYTLSPIGLPLRPGKLPCTFYVKNGICKFGSVCKFDHPVSRSAYNSSASCFNDMPFDLPFRGSMDTTLLSSSDSSLEASKVQ